MSHDCKRCTNLAFVKKTDPRWTAAATEWRSWMGSWCEPVDHISWCVKRHRMCRWYDAFFSMDQCGDYRPDFPANRLPGGRAT